MQRQPCVYLLASDRNGTIYLGVTSNLIARVWQHRAHVVDGFSLRYGVTRLVWFEQHDTMEEPSSARSGSRNGIAHGKSG